MALKKSKNIEAKGIGKKRKPNVPAYSMPVSMPSKSDNSTSEPYVVFLRCIKRAKNLINFHSPGKNPNEEHFCDAYRASVVLTIAALDAYIRTLAITKIKVKLSKRPKLTDPLYEYIKSIMTQDDLLESAMNDSFLKDIEEKISADFQKEAFQGERKITHYMNLVGFKNVISNVAQKNETNENNLIEKINKFTKRRHTIAHGGDYDITVKPYKEIEIKKEYAEDCVKTVSDFVQTLNEICFK